MLVWFLLVVLVWFYRATKSPGWLKPADFGAVVKLAGGFLRGLKSYLIRSDRRCVAGLNEQRLLQVLDPLLQHRDTTLKGFGACI